MPSREQEDTETPQDRNSPAQPHHRGCGASFKAARCSTLREQSKYPTVSGVVKRERNGYQEKGVNVIEVFVKDT